MKPTFTSILFLLFAQLSIAQPDTCIILQPDAQGGKDALLHGLSSQVNNNFGNENQFVATTWTFSGPEGTVRSVVEFDLSGIPAGSTINSADLTLYGWTTSSGMGYHDAINTTNEGWLERVVSAWDESTVTWSTQPSTTTLNRVTVPASTSQSQDYFLDVSALVTDMINDPVNSHGFMLKMQNEVTYKRLNFGSSDHADPTKRPMLEVCYTLDHTGVSDLEDNLFTITPNPTTGDFKINFSNASEDNTCRILNSNGQLVRLLNIAGTNSVEVKTLQTGIYFIQYSSGSKTVNKKVLVQ